MQGLSELYNYSPLSSGEVYRNSKTKLYTDGTTNTIVCKSSIFKDKTVVTEEPENKIENKRQQEELEQLAYMDKIDKVYSILDSKKIREWEFKELMDKQYDDDFLIALNNINMSLSEYDFCASYFKKNLPQSKTPRSKNINDPRDDSVKRSKDNIFDYVLNNEFDYFFTGTINPENLDSKSPKEVFQPIQDWLKNMVRRYNLHYVMVAELHKNGGIHFHGLFKADNLRLIDSGTKLYKGHKKPISNERAERMGLYAGLTVYNLQTWSFGFSTCVALTGDRMNTAFYITKYITKDCKKIFGKFFWHSQNLKKPDIIIDDIDFDSIQSIERNGFKYIFQRSESNATE